MTPVLPFSVTPIDAEFDFPPEPATATATPPPEDPPVPVVAAAAEPPSDPQAAAQRVAVVLRSATQPVIVRADAYVCESPVDYAHAAALLDELATMEQTIDNKLGPIIDEAFKVHRGLTALRAEMKDPIVARQKAIKQRAAQWRADEDRKARAEAEALAAEQRRIEAAAAEETAKALEQDGQAEIAAQVREEAKAAPLPAVHVPSTVPKVAGMVERFDYGYEIVKIEDIPKEYFVLDRASLMAVVKRQKEACTIPGIRVTKTPATTFRKGAR